MSPTSLDLISSVYSCSVKVRIHTTSVKNPELKVFSNSLDKLIRSLDDSVNDDFWKPIIRVLKNFRFELCSAPLSHKYVLDSAKKIQDQLNAATAACKLLYPNSTAHFLTLKDSIDGIPDYYRNELAKSILELLHQRKKGEVAVLIKEPRLIGVTEEVLLPIRGSINLVVVTPELLKDIHCYDMIIVVGPHRWFPEFVFSAPRSKEFAILKYSWIKDPWYPKDIFTEQVKQKKSSHSFVMPTYDPNDSEDLDAESLLPPAVDIQNLNRKAEDETTNQTDYVEARAYLLEGDWAVFLEADEEALVSIIDLEPGNIKPVKRTRVKELEVGMFLLLRTSGGGDFIVPVANKIMGLNAEIAREYQREWKKLLRKMVRTKGFTHTIKKLQENGSKIANRINVGNWISERSIRTEEYEDFLAIMKLVKLEAHAQDYWKMMKLIEAAHLQAGVVIRKMLLNQVQKISIQELIRTGIMEFSIPGENVSITAFRINQISDSVVRVMPWRIGTPIKQE